MLRVFDWTTNSFTPRILRYNSLHKKVSKSPSISIKMMRTDTNHCPRCIWCPPSVTQHFSTQSSLPLCCMSGQSCIWLPPTTHNAGATDGWGGLTAKTHALCGWVFNFYSCLMSLHKGWLEIKKTLDSTCQFQLRLKSCNLASLTTKWDDYATGTMHQPTSQSRASWKSESM